MKKLREIFPIDEGEVVPFDRAAGMEKARKKNYEAMKDKHAKGLSPIQKKNKEYFDSSKETMDDKVKRFRKALPD